MKTLKIESVITNSGKEKPMRFSRIEDKDSHGTEHKF